MLIKIDVGGFGSGVLRPILKDVPVLNLILPDVSDKDLAEEYGYEYNSIVDANQRIEELEEILSGVVVDFDDDTADYIAELEAEISRLKVIEENQEEFKERQKSLIRMWFLQKLHQILRSIKNITKPWIQLMQKLYIDK